MVKHPAEADRGMGPAAEHPEPDPAATDADGDLQPPALQGVEEDPSAEQSDVPSLGSDAQAAGEPKGKAGSRKVVAENARILVGKLRLVDENDATLTYSLKVDSGRLREEPSLSAKVKQLLPRGTQLSVVFDNGDWVYVRLAEEGTGWVHKSLL